MLNRVKEWIKNKLDKYCPIELVDRAKEFYKWATTQVGVLLIFTDILYSYIPFIHVYISEGVSAILGSVIIILRVTQLKEAPVRRR